MFAGLVAVGLALGISAGAIHPTVARAVACDKFVPYNTDARTNDGVDNHRGGRADGSGSNGIWVPDLGTSVSCIRVSSIIIVANGGDDTVEAGWFDASGAPECSYTGNGGARQLWFATVNGSRYCATQTPSLIGNTNAFHGFSVSDIALDGNWSWAMDGTSFKTNFFTMEAGVVTSNGERHGNDVANSEFTQLQWESGSGWHDWVNPSTYTAVISVDPLFHNQFYSDDTHVKVVHD